MFSLYTNEAIARTLPSQEGEYGFQFVWIPSGTFVMGSPETEVYRTANEGPTHPVTIAQGFYMQTTEMTQKKWKEVMGADNNPAGFRGDSLPIENVGWVDCVAFIDKLNLLDPKRVYRLPSEAEWEYACRAGTTTRFFWGDDPDYVILPQYAWTTANCGGTTHPVGLKLPNPWGLYDITGNIYEWCQDTYHTTYEGAPADGSAWEESGVTYRIMRGGGWTGHEGNARSAARFAHFEVPRVNNHGFRVVYR
jgi:formylglycine-generating enzyme required for sulfatase activity